MHERMGGREEEEFGKAEEEGGVRLFREIGRDDRTESERPGPRLPPLARSRSGCTFPAFALTNNAHRQTPTQDTEHGVLLPPPFPSPPPSPSPPSSSISQAAPAHVGRPRFHSPGGVAPLPSISEGAAMTWLPRFTPRRSPGDRSAPAPLAPAPMGKNAPPNVVPGSSA